VVCAFEQVGVDAESDVRVGVTELAGNEDHVEAFGDQEGGVAVAELVKGKPLADDAQPCSLDRLAEVFADFPVVEAAAEGVGEDGLVGRFEG